MSDVFYLGGATTAVHSGTLTLTGTWENDDLVTFVVTGEDNAKTTLSVTTSSTVISTICTNVAAGWNASTHYLLTPVTAAGGGSTITFSGDVAGVPHNISPTTTESGGGAADAQTVTYTSGTSVGPYDFKTPANWSGGVFPSNSDNINFDGRMSYAISYGLVNTLSPANVNFDCPSYSIGTTTAALRLGTVTGVMRVSDLLPDNSRGSMTQLINVNTAAATLDVRGTASSGLSGLAPFTIGGGTFLINQTGGNMAVGVTTPGEACTLSDGSTLSSGFLTLGTGVVWTGKTLINSGGQLYASTAGATTTLTLSGGTTTIDGTAKLAVCNISKGTLYANMRLSGNEIDELNPTGGNIDFSRDLTGWTVGTLNVSPSIGTFSIIRAPGQGGTISTVGALTFPTGKNKLTFGAG